MPEWVRLCSVSDAPAEGDVMEAEAAGVPVCLARIDGAFHVMDNECPHRQGPLGQGWVEGRAVVCPWHAWAFDVDSGIAAEPEQARVAVYAVKQEGDDLWVHHS